MKNDILDKLAIPEARAKAPASFAVQPLLYPENGMRKWGMFTLGVVAGVAAVTMAQTILEELPQYADNSDRNTLRQK